MNSYPAPIPSLGFYEQTFPDRQAPAEIESDIGPYVIRGDTIWFATTFYDGEGTSGIGAIGSFDILERRYEMRYLPEIAPWSGSAMWLYHHDLWIGLKRRPEGPDLGGGLLRYNIDTGAVKTFPVPGVITNIANAPATTMCALTDNDPGTVCADTDQGRYLLRDGKVTKVAPPSK